MGCRVKDKLRYQGLSSKEWKWREGSADANCVPILPILTQNLRLWLTKAEVYIPSTYNSDVTRLPIPKRIAFIYKWLYFTRLNFVLKVGGNLVIVLLGRFRDAREKEYLRSTCFQDSQEEEISGFSDVPQRQAWGSNTKGWPFRCRSSHQCMYPRKQQWFDYPRYSRRMRSQGPLRRQKCHNTLLQNQTCMRIRPSSWRQTLLLLTQTHLDRPSKHMRSNQLLHHFRPSLFREY